MLKVFQARPQATPAPPPATAPAIASVVGELPPQTPAEYTALLARRTELNAQLQWLQGQRSNVVGHIRGRIASEADRVGLDAQLQAIDKQILQVDANIAQTSQLIAQAPASALPATRTVPPPYQNQPRRDNVTAGVFLTTVSIIFIIFPLTVAFIRRMGRSAAHAGLPPRFEETPARLERLEQALETVAIEVERISESQRFMTRLMTETQLYATAQSWFQLDTAT